MTKTLTVTEAHALARTAIANRAQELIDRTSYEGATILQELARMVSEHEVTAGLSADQAAYALGFPIREALEAVASGWDLVVASKTPAPPGWDTDEVHGPATLAELVRTAMTNAIAQSLIQAVREAWERSLGDFAMNVRTVED